MIEMKNQSESAILVAHEIYGINQHMIYTCKALGKHGFDVFCPNLLDRPESFVYEEEQVAYSYFMTNIGFDKAAAAIQQKVTELKASYKQVFLVGFSVGATASWICSNNPDVAGVVGYYGSRIRSYMDVSPACPALLFYPEIEPSFQVDELITSLKDKPQVEVHKISGQHGFSDPYSARYLEASANEAFHFMLTFLKSKG
jgi:dienelactone hydrolase